MAEIAHPVDPAARRIAARLVRDFAGGSITNHELCDSWPMSTDPALDEIAQRLWFTYDDLITHKRVGSRAPGPEEREFFERCALFLESDALYPWRRLRPTVWTRALLMLSTLGLWCLIDRLLGLSRGVSGDHYPFASRDAWLSAMKRAESPFTSSR